jgi:Potato inhibitor I family
MSDIATATPEAQSQPRPVVLNDEENPAIVATTNSSTNAAAAVPVESSQHPVNLKDDEGGDEDGSITDTIEDTLSHSQHDGDKDHEEYNKGRSSNNQDALNSSKTRRRILYLLLVAMVLVLAIGLGVGLSYNNNKNYNNQSLKETESSEAEQDAVLDTQSPTSLVPEEETETPPKEMEEEEVEEPLLEFAKDQMVFPELVGMDGEEAKTLLENHYPGMYDIYIIPDDFSVTMDFDVYRIRIFVDADTNIITRAPMVG